MKPEHKSNLRNKKIIAVLLAAVLMCGIASFGVYQILTPQRTTVYVFSDSYSAGTLVTEQMLTPIEIDRSIVAGSNSLSAGDYFVTNENYKNVITSAGVLRNDVNAGNALMTSMLTTTGGNPIEMTMRKNAVAVTIGANLITGVTNDLSAGSRVNVYASYDSGSTTLTMESIRVLSVGRDGGILTSVTLEVDIAQSLQLIHAYTYGSVHLGLVDTTGYSPSESRMPTYSLNGFSSAG